MVAANGQFLGDIQIVIESVVEIPLRSVDTGGWAFARRLAGGDGAIQNGECNGLHIRHRNQKQRTDGDDAEGAVAEAAEGGDAGEGESPGGRVGDRDFGESVTVADTAALRPVASADKKVLLLEVNRQGTTFFFAVTR